MDTHEMQFGVAEELYGCQMRGIRNQHDAIFMGAEKRCNNFKKFDSIGPSWLNSRQKWFKIAVFINWEEVVANIPISQPVRLVIVYI